MSEIQRYDCEEDRSCEYEVKAVMQVNSTGYYVRHADHVVYLNEMRMDRDVERLRADTAEAEAEAELKDLREQVELWKGRTTNLTHAQSAAEQRIANLKGALENLLDAYSKPDDRICCSGHDCGCMGATDHQLAEHCAKEALAALSTASPATINQQSEVAREALKMPNQRITPARFNCLACGEYHEGSGNLPCPKMSPYAALNPKPEAGSHE